jgi:hypothetical protein
VEGDVVKFAVKYLKGYLDRAEASGVCAESVMYHSLIWLLAKHDDRDEQGLVDYLETLINKQIEGCLSSTAIDSHHILRQCRRYHRKKAEVLVYMLMGQHQEAISAALVIDIDLAKSFALMQIDDDRKRESWLKIARHVISTENDIKGALSLLSESDGLLRIEHLLPFLPDFTEIDLFKDEICTTLNDYGARIEHLKTEMNELSESAESIVNELDSMKRRGYSLTAQQRCEYCSIALFGKQFYLFPCSHGFHADCLLRRIHLHVDATQLHHVRGLEEQLKLSASRTKDASDKRALALMEYLQTELDGCIAADCPLCGFAMIKSLGVPLITPDDADDLKSWAL